MCGVVGTIAQRYVNQDIFDALTALQHRGQDAAGIVTCEGEHLHLRKSNGLVREVIHTRHMLRLRGNMGIGHVRYPTAGGDNEELAQPFYVNSPYGLTLAHNGNITNDDFLRKELIEKDMRHLSTDSDSEIILNVLAHALQEQGKVKPDPQTVFTAVADVHRRCEGAYAVVAMLTDFGIVGFRDPFGIRPIVYGVRETEQGKDYMIASESIALDALGYKVIDDIGPGEAVYITLDGQVYRQQCAPNPQLSPCLFEYIYLARPDSMLDKSLVYKARLNMGTSLGEKILRLRPNHDIDVVIPVPDTSRPIAHALSKTLKVKYREGFVKNRYIGRTFIMPGQKIRKKSVRQKLNPIGLEFKDKNVLLVDDSIVRGTTSKQIVQMARDVGAKNVYFASAAPEVRYPNVYGIDMPAAKELVAHGRDNAEICAKIGADWLIYHDLEAVKEAVLKGNPEIKQFDASVFDGKYITGNIDATYLTQLEVLRNNKSREAKQQT